MEELRNLVQYYEIFNEPLEILAVSLSARKNLCINPDVNQHRLGKIVDGQCLKLTASFVRAKRQSDPSIPCCEYFEVEKKCHILFDLVEKFFHEKSRYSMKTGNFFFVFSLKKKKKTFFEFFLLFD